MALLTLFINRPQKTEIQRTVSNGASAIVMDAQISESFKADAEATEHPIEDDTDVMDHIILKPNQLSIVGIISETPLTLGSSLAGVASTVGSTVGGALATKLGGAGLGALGGAVGSVGAGLAGKTLAGLLGLSSTNRMGGVIAELISTRDTKDPVTIQTGLQQYKDYVLTSVQVERNQHDGRAIRCSLTFKQLLRVSADTVKVNIPKITSGLSKKNLGKQGITDPDSSQGKKSSLLYSGFKSGGLLN